MKITFAKIVLLLIFYSFANLNTLNAVSFANSPAISDAYQNCLGRDPKPDDLNFYNNLIANGERSREQISSDICNSEEAKNKDEAGADDQTPNETFLWKPESDADGKLVVLLPSSMRGQVTSVAITKDGKTLDKGKFSGDTHNGMRPHFRFPKEGSEYGSEIQVVSMGTNGACSWKIEDGSERTEGVESDCETTALSGYALSNFNIGKYLNNIRGGTFTGGLGEGCEPYYKPEPGVIPDRVEGVSLVSSKQSLTAYQPGYRASSWMMFHKGDAIKLRGTGYLMIAWESEAHHPSAPISSTFVPPGMSGNITYVGDLPDDGKSNAHLPIGAPGMHAWPDGSGSRLRLFCIDGEATIIDRENTGGTQWYNMMIDVVPPTCEPTRRIQTNFVPYSEALVDRCATKLKPTETEKTNAISSNYSQSFTTNAVPTEVTTTKNETSANGLSLSCSVSKTSILIDDEITISAKVSGGESPYKIKWSGDISEINKISKTKASQNISFAEAGRYVLQVKATDNADDTSKVICSPITVYKEKTASSQNTNVTYTTPNFSSYNFTRDLTVGSEGSDVVALQDFLIARGFLKFPTGVAKGHFGNLTRDALAYWQSSKGIAPATGYFGSKSRAQLY